MCAVSGQRATQFCQEYAEEPGSGVIRSRSTAVSEYFRRGTENLPFCTVHSGVLGEGGAAEGGAAEPARAGRRAGAAARPRAVR